MGYLKIFLDVVVVHDAFAWSNVKGNLSVAMAFHFEVKDLSNDRVLLTPFSVCLDILDRLVLSSTRN